MFFTFLLLVGCSSLVGVCSSDGNSEKYDYRGFSLGPKRWNSNRPESLVNYHKRSNNENNYRTTRIPDSLESPSESEESTEFDSEALKNFLNTYAKKYKKPIGFRQENENSGEEHNQQDESKEKLEENDDDKSKSWDLKNVGKNKTPFDHKSGWVTLEAVPWSVSKVSKWEGKPERKPDIPKITSRPQTYDGDRFERPKPNYNTYKPHHHDIPSYGNNDDEDVYRRPSYSQNKYSQSSFGQNFEVLPDDYEQRPPVRRYTTQKPFKDRFDFYENGGGAGSSRFDDLITDGKPSNFPSYNDHYNRRVSASSSSYDDHPYPTHPENGNVLPPLEDSKVNMTTSHGGMLQVESTFQTVDEAQKQHAAENEKNKRRRIGTTTTTKKPWRVWKKRNQTTRRRTGSFTNSEEQIENTNKTITVAANNLQAAPDGSAVMAAVGAGMIPATMAMLLPMAMSGRRRKRSLKFFNHNSNLH